MPLTKWFFASKYDYHLYSWNYLFPLGIISVVGTYNTVTDKSDVYSFWVVLIELISSMPVVLAARERDEVNLANIVIKRFKKESLVSL